jgi:hypothetical protein
VAVTVGQTGGNLVTFTLSSTTTTNVNYICMGN